MLGYLSADIICSEKQTVFRERSTRAYFAPNGGYCLYYPSNLFRNARSLKIGGYLTIIRRRRSEYWWIFPETKSRGIFTNIHEPEANNCFSIITQVIIEIPKHRNVKFYHNSLLANKLNLNLNLNVSRNAFLNSRSEENTFSYRVKTNQNVVYHGLYSYRQWVRFITLFPNNFLLLLLHVERVCKNFLKGKSDAYK